MKKIRNLVAAGALTIAMGITSLTVYAAAKYDSPQEALSGITGKTIEEIASERFEEGKTYGEIAAEAGKLDEFRDELFEQKKEIIEERVTEGSLSREYADEMLYRFENNQNSCFGNGRGMMGGHGFRFGNGERGRGMMGGYNNRSGSNFGRNR